MSLKIVHQVLTADPTVTAAIGERISPVQSQMNEPFPRIVISTHSVSPHNTLAGSGALDRCEVLVDCWASDYGTAKGIADAARAALLAAGHLLVGGSEDKFEFATDTSAFSVSYIFQVWQTVGTPS
jgi:hypothetical protein